MSVDFSNNGATDWYEAAGAIALPDADWAILFWMHLTAPLSGPGLRYYLSNSPLNVVGEVTVYIDAGASGLRARLRDATNPRLFINGPSISGSGSFLCGAQRRGATKESFVCPKGGSAVFSSPNTDALGAVSSANLWNIGRRQDGDVDRYSKDIFGETAVILNDSLTQAQIEDLARGRKTIFDLGFTPEAYWRLRTPGDLTDQSGDGHTLTKNGAPKDSPITFIGPQPPDADHDGGVRILHVVDTRKRERAEEEGRRERQRFRKELRTTVDRALRTAIDGKPPKQKTKRKAKRARDDRAATQSVKRKPKRQGSDPKVRDIAAMIAARRR